MTGRLPLRGEIWYSYMPGQPRDPHQPRPALVVSVDIRNQNRDHAMMVPIYSHGRTGPTHVALAAGEGGIPWASVLFCEELSTVDYTYLTQGPLGDLVSDDVLAAVVRAVRRAIGDVVQ